MCYHGIQVMRSNLICYLLLCLTIFPDRDIEIISNPINGIEYLCSNKKKGRKKEDFGLWSISKKQRGKMEYFWSGVV